MRISDWSSDVCSSDLCTRPDTDPDRAFRARMVQDVRDRVAELGPIGAILIGGDIAFKAHPDEYACALAWIEQLIAVTGCSHERVYVVPGNHDVDRRSEERRVGKEVSVRVDHGGGRIIKKKINIMN